MEQIYSVGHSNHEINNFCELLKQSKIDYLIDVRSVPYSKYYPQYNQKILSNSLELMKIKYLFLGEELGGRINDPTCYKNEIIPEKKVGYALHLNYDKIINKEWFNSGINKIIELIQKGNCAIMCSEENPEKCHRELIIGRRLREIGISIIHIRANKNKQDQLNLF